jgi:hypothetical protein
MKFLPRVIFILSVLLASQSYAASAPEQLKGKSIVVSWTESRQQKNVGWNNFRTVNASHQLSIYISTKGRVFSRQTNSTRAGTGSTEQVAGEGGGGPYSTRTPSFGGQSMTVIGENKGGARRAVIDFDASFTSCKAKASTAFEAGKTSVSFSPITHQRVEIKSVITSGESCSIQSGNVLGGPT